MQSSFANRVMPTACNGRLASFRVPPLAASLLASDGTRFPTLLQSGFAFLYENPGFRKASAQGAKSRAHRSFSSSGTDQLVSSFLGTKRRRDAIRKSLEIARSKLFFVFLPGQTTICCGVN